TGFETCLRQDHLVETTAVKGGSKQSKFLSRTEVQERCLQTAARLVAKEKSAAAVNEWIKTSFRNTPRVNAIDLIKRLVELERKRCNDPEVYDTVLDIFSAPRRDDPLS